MLSRRRFLRRTMQNAAVAGGIGLALKGAEAAARAEPAPAGRPAAQIPRYRGFNLCDKFKCVSGRTRPFSEQDFDLIASWGFDFVRLPMDYRCWTSADDPYRLDERRLGQVDQAVRWGVARKIHVNLNLHRIPGYCVNPPREPLNLWESEKALEQACLQWKTFAERYRDIDGGRVSFNLINEPARVKPADHDRVVRALAAAVRRVDPDRLIFVDGMPWGSRPVLTLADLGVVMSTRGYEPMRISHWKASWITGAETWPEPTWPLEYDGKRVDKASLYRGRILPFVREQSKFLGVHVGEFGAFRHTPHKVVLAWMRDCLDLWKQAGWGWALWGLHGHLGLMDTHRADVKYEKVGQYQLDRKMLELLKQG